MNFVKGGTGALKVPSGLIGASATNTFVSLGPDRVTNTESPDLNPDPSKTIFVSFNLDTERRMNSGFTIACGPEIEGSSFLGEFAHPKRMIKHAKIINLEKIIFF
jgi:hypothetical protein